MGLKFKPELVCVQDTMSQYVMPVVVLNLGGEMVYILHQRLNAQNVQKTKENKVLREVIGAMYEPAFVDELFAPQEMYPLSAVKQIFTKLAHSSLMRLNTSSMDKLFDLMIMGLKHQLMNVSSPWDIIHTTLIHVYCLQNLIMESGEHTNVKAQETLNSISYTLSKLQKLYSSGGPCSYPGAMLSVKQSLHNLLQGKKIKASLFLQKGQQGADGHFNLSNAGVLPFGTEYPGSVKVYKNGRPIRVTKVKMSMVAFAGSHERKDGTFWEPDFTYGSNVYSINKSIFCLQDPERDHGMKTTIVDQIVGLLGEYGGGARGGAVGATFKPGTMTGEAARAEAKLTLSLLGSGAKGSGASSKASSSGAGAPRLHLAALLDHSSAASSAAKAGDDGDDGGFIDINIVEIDAQADAKTVDSMLESLDLKGVLDSGAKADSKGGYDGGWGEGEGEEDEDDLLALMDGAK